MLMTWASAIEEPPERRPTEIAVLLPAVTAALFLRMSLPVGLFESDFLKVPSPVTSPVVDRIPDLLLTALLALPGAAPRLIIGDSLTVPRAVRLTYATSS